MLQQSEVEKAYRRGYGQGAARAVDAMKDGTPIGEVEDWVYLQLWPWREETEHSSWPHKKLIEVQPPPRLAGPE